IKALLILISGTIISALTVIFMPLNIKGYVSHIGSNTLAKAMLIIAGVKLKIEGSEHINGKEKYIFVSNHLSYFDIPVITSAIPNNIRFIYKKSISYVPFFGWAVYFGGYVAVDRSNARSGFEAIKKAASIIKNKGLSFIIFPEGTRSPDGNIGNFKRGAFLLAEEAKVKIVPVTIIGSDKILPKKSYTIKSGEVKIIFEKPIDYRDDKNFLNDIRDLITKNYEKYK
ncbi:MAG: lysophospholipid acyltransferase family protein, partial [Ignavibacteria bacterium]